jgi:hypothetical protein
LDIGDKGKDRVFGEGFVILKNIGEWEENFLNENEF